jgi:hypothetical protein
MILSKVSNNEGNILYLKRGSCGLSDSTISVFEGCAMAKLAVVLRYKTEEGRGFDSR